VFQFRAGDEFSGTRMRRLSAEHFLNHRIVCAKLRSEIGQGICQAQDFVVVIDWFSRKKLQLQGLACAVAKVRESFAIGLGAPVEHAQDVREIAIARIDQFIQSELSIRLTRVAAYKNQFTIIRPIRIEFQKVLDLRWLTVFVNAKKADIEIVSWILKIVGITA